MSLPDREPSARELAAIEAEWPLIAAELAVTTAEIDVLAADRVSLPLALRRLARAYRHAEATAVQAPARPAGRQPARRTA